MSNPQDHYTYRVSYSPEDRQHVASVAEWPSLSWLADTPADALAGAQRLVLEILEDMAQSGEEAPVPFSERQFSGKFAAEQRVSINRLVASRLSGRTGSERKIA
jgi:predicted RNase H-like HicB family nuclease